MSGDELKTEVVVGDDNTEFVSGNCVPKTVVVVGVTNGVVTLLIILVAGVLTNGTLEITGLLTIGETVDLTDEIELTDPGEGVAVKTVVARGVELTELYTGEMTDELLLGVILEMIDLLEIIDLVLGLVLEIPVNGEAVLLKLVLLLGDLLETIELLKLLGVIDLNDLANDLNDLIDLIDLNDLGVCIDDLRDDYGVLLLNDDLSEDNGVLLLNDDLNEDGVLLCIDDLNDD